MRVILQFSSRFSSSLKNQWRETLRPTVTDLRIIVIVVFEAQLFTFTWEELVVSQLPSLEWVYKYLSVASHLLFLSSMKTSSFQYLLHYGLSTSEIKSILQVQALLDPFLVYRAVTVAFSYFHNPHLESKSLCQGHLLKVIEYCYFPLSHCYLRFYSPFLSLHSAQS